MAEVYGFSNELQDTVDINPSKKSPLLLRMVFLSAAMLYSVSICSTLLKQTEKPGQLHAERANLSKSTLPQVVRVGSMDESLPNAVRIDSTKKISSAGVSSFDQIQKVNLNLTRQNSKERVNLTEKTFSPVVRVNFTEKAFVDRRIPQSQKACRLFSLYAIISMQRSGSKWFEDLLNSHENIKSHGEIFSNVDRKCNMTVIRQVLDKVYSLNGNTRAFRRERKSCLDAVGFKWMLNQGLMDHHKEVSDYFNNRGVSAILLFRRNHLRRLVSLRANAHDGMARILNGTHQAHVHSQEEATILASYKPKLNVKRLISTMDHMERLAVDTLHNFRSTHHMVVYYEDLIKNQSKMMDVLEFLKLSKRELVSDHVKIHTRPLEEQIQNWKAVFKVIKHTKYVKFINDNDYEM